MQAKFQPDRKSPRGSKILFSPSKPPYYPINPGINILGYRGLASCNVEPPSFFRVYDSRARESCRQFESSRGSGRPPRSSYVYKPACAHTAEARARSRSIEMFSLFSNSSTVLLIQCVLSGHRENAPHQMQWLCEMDTETYEAPTVE